ncbi:NADPH-dependent F420 reductase [Cesiribacter andamanensis]|uniref:2-dehydropantoate 2-reductase n=1 Tax=Cesiribacter andamanensis AMV16 TaxID=1279009 RepID=M7N7Q2_9BACT|nr:NAD(P)-binding domain-containing protein [Cesiribacter andamanensis]EMR03251.1 2-dehydropantoate 2-reductase [Cesiribacter andamanensis AMV16]
MNITILGTGMVGQTIAAKLQELGHQITLGTRSVNDTLQRTAANPMTGTSFADWHATHSGIRIAPYQEAATDADLIINATSGAGSLEALRGVGSKALAGKVLLDVANPLDFSKGMPPTLFVCNTDSLGEQIQREFPEARVVKGLNTMNAYLMMNPQLVPGDHTVLLSGNDADAKKEIVRLLNSLGWKEKNIIDLGDISTARGTEMLLPVWIRLWGALGSPEFNFHIARKVPVEAAV